MILIARLNVQAGYVTQSSSRFIYIYLIIENICHTFMHLDAAFSRRAAERILGFISALQGLSIPALLGVTTDRFTGSQFVAERKTVPRSKIMGPTDKNQMRRDRKARKRQKLSSNFTGPLNPTRLTTARIESLPWTSVPVPDNLDDAEGFYGLEELSDVEVVRDEHAGKIEFRVGMSSRAFLSLSFC